MWKSINVIGHINRIKTTPQHMWWSKWTFGKVKHLFFILKNCSTTSWQRPLSTSDKEPKELGHSFESLSAAPEPGVKGGLPLTTSVNTVCEGPARDSQANQPNRILLPHPTPDQPLPASQDMRLCSKHCLLFFWVISVSSGSPLLFLLFCFILALGFSSRVCASSQLFCVWRSLCRCYL